MYTLQFDYQDQTIKMQLDLEDLAKLLNTWTYDSIRFKGNNSTYATNYISYGEVRNISIVYESDTPKSKVLEATHWEV